MSGSRTALLLYTYLIYSIESLSSTQTTHLNIAWLAPLERQNGISAGGGVMALQLALQHIRQTGLLNSTNIRVMWMNSKCESKSALFSAATLHDSKYRPVLFLGPACSDAMRCVAEMASYWNIPVFSMMSSDADLGNKARFSTLVRLLGPLNVYQSTLRFLAKKFNWRRFYLVVDDWSAYVGVAVALKEEAKLQNYVIQEAPSTVNKDSKTDELKNIFNDAKASKKTIFLMVVSWEDMSRYVGVASSLNMTGEDYVFICIHDDLFNKETLTTKVFSTWIWSKNQSNVTKRDFANVLHVTMAMRGIKSIMNFANSKIHDNILHQHVQDYSIPNSTGVDPYAPFLYDAVMTWARIVNRTLHEGGDPKNGTDIFRRAINFSYPDGLSGPIHLNSNGDRKQNMWIIGMNASGYFQIVGELTYNTKTGGLDADVSNLRWASGKTGPENAPPHYLILKNDIIHNNDLGIIIGGVASTVLLFVFVFFLAFRCGHRRHLRRSMQWKIASSNIEFITHPSVEAEAKAQSCRVRRHESLCPNDGAYLIRYRKPSGISDVSEEPDEFNHVQIFAPIAYVNGIVVAVKRLPDKHGNLNKTITLELNQLISLKHPNVCGFVGACVEPGNVSLLWEYCNKGSIQDVMWNENIKLDSVFQYSICLDVAKGLDYIHKSSVGYHGNLKSSNCVIDSRWTCKLTDFGAPSLINKDNSRKNSDAEPCESPIWSKSKTQNYACVCDRQKVDIYQLGVIVKEVIFQNGIFESMPQSDGVDHLTFKKSSLPFRPSTQDNTNSKEVISLLFDCWMEEPRLRPTAHKVIKVIQRINPNKNGGVIDNMVLMLEKYANDLEDIVSERTRQLNEEKAKTEDLLYRMLPRTVAEDLRIGKKVEAELFDNVTVYFSDIVGFTSICAKSTPLQVVDMLNTLYTLFDDIITKYDVYKVETIGDAYMLVSGLPRRNGLSHSYHVCDCALDLLKSVTGFTPPDNPNFPIRIRIGVHSGPVVAGVVGLTMPRYCLFGDTVNTASRMETTGLPMKIHISPATYSAIIKDPGYCVIRRGDIYVKGKGLLTTYFLEDKLSDYVKNSKLVHQNSRRHRSVQKTVSNPSGGRYLDVNRHLSIKSLSRSSPKRDLISRNRLQASIRSLRASFRRPIKHEPSSVSVNVVNENDIKKGFEPLPSNAYVDVGISISSPSDQSSITSFEFSSTTFPPFDSPQKLGATPDKHLAITVTDSSANIPAIKLHDVKINNNVQDTQQNQSYL